MKTQINTYIQTPEGREDEIKKQFEHILIDEDIDFNLIHIGQFDDSKMELVYLNEDLKEVPLLSISVNMDKLSKKFERTQIQDYFAKFGYAISSSKMLAEPNKQYFMFAYSEGDFCKVNFLNPGTHTQKEIDSISEKIKTIANDIYNSPKDFVGNYFEEIAKEDPDLDMQWKNEEGNKIFYQMSHKKEPVTEWLEHKPDHDWTEFIKELHEQYKNNLPE